MEALGEVVGSLNDRGGELTIYAPLSRPLTPASRVTVAREGQVIDEGLHYFLEVRLAAEALAVWSEWRSGRKPTVDEAVDAVEWYADHDAYMPVGA
jgi:hypothetical protein